MAFVTTGTTGTEKQVVLLGDEDEVLARLSSDDARRLAIKLLEKAQQIEQPAAVSEWP
ncbi:hypothetical protein [Cryobacterium sp. TMS1-13-1]|uniref:hypothetical protein n=1 Tax=Cryobacterium sp. TMS1-13-1 TaxID=1259220 RepID=UPI00141B5529|nr:hypothetical protein [Cryobacterium sp. TMS1-13-1]